MDGKDGQTARALSGKLIDANGRVGTLTVTMGTNNRASWVLLLAERDGNPVEMKGELDLKIEGSRVQLKGSEMVQDSKITWEIDLSRQPAGQYAREALVGQYSTSGTSSLLPLSKGVVVLWDFK